MVWITGVCRTENGMVVNVQELDGERAQVPFTEVDASAGPRSSGKRNHRQLSLDLTTLRASQAADYLRGLELQTLDSGSQVVYETDFELGKLVIPAQLLIAQLLAPSAACREALLKPWGPSHLMSVFPEVGQQLLTIPTPNRMMQRQLDMRPTTTSRFEWMQSYPSGHAAWCSVYRRALDGQVDIALPRAIVDISFGAHRDGKRLLVTQLVARRLRPLEAPFEFAQGFAANEFSFQVSSAPSQRNGKGRAIVVEAALQSRGLAGPMTGDQWERVDRLLKERLALPGSNGRAPRCLREVVDVILLKLGTPYSWTNIPVSRQLVSSASVLLHRLQKRGVWNQVVEALTRD